MTGLTYRFAVLFQTSAAQWRVDAATAGGGHFLDLGSHVLDLIDFLTGPVAEVQGTAANLASAYAVEDAVAMSFRTAAGAPATAAWNFAGSPPEDELALTGTRGRVRFSVFGFEPVRLATAEGIQSLVCRAAGACAAADDPGRRRRSAGPPGEPEHRRHGAPDLGGAGPRAGRLLWRPDPAVPGNIRRDGPGDGRDAAAIGRARRTCSRGVRTPRRQKKGPHFMIE